MTTKSRLAADGVKVDGKDGAVNIGAGGIKVNGADVKVNLQGGIADGDKACGDGENCVMNCANGKCKHACAGSSCVSNCAGGDCTPNLH